MRVAVRWAGGVLARSRATEPAAASARPRSAPAATVGSEATKVMAARSMPGTSRLRAPQRYRLSTMPSTSAVAASAADTGPTGPSRTTASSVAVAVALAKAAAASCSTEVVTVAAAPMPTATAGPGEPGTTRAWPTAPVKPAARKAAVPTPRDAGASASIATSTAVAARSGAAAATATESAALRGMEGTGSNPGATVMACFMWMHPSGRWSDGAETPKAPLGGG